MSPPSRGKPQDPKDEREATLTAHLRSTSHELKNQLAGLVGMMELLSFTPLDENQRRYLQGARAAAELLEQRVLEALDMAYGLELSAPARARPSVPPRPPRPSRPSRSSIPPRPSRPSPGPQTRRVLVVEDSPVNAEVAAGLLETAGIACDVAEDGQAALAALTKASYDAILMDCDLPDMDGFTVTRAVRSMKGSGALARSGSGPVPIVAVTAHAGPEAAARCEEAGMDRHLEKPLDGAALLRVLRELWASPQSP